MRLFSKITILALSGVMLFCAPDRAQASVYFWESQDKNVSATFPDSWKRVHNQGANDVLTVVAPAGRDFATCKISAQEDGRFKIYPAYYYGGPVQRQHYSYDMWEAHYGVNKRAVFHDVIDNAGLSKGFASMANVSYETQDGPKMMKRAIAFASLYNNVLYTVECSAEESVYEKWHNSFLSFIKSVNLEAHTNFAVEGYYRSFLDDCLLKIKGETVLDDTYY